MPTSMSIFIAALVLVLVGGIFLAYENGGLRGLFTTMGMMGIIVGGVVLAALFAAWRDGLLKK